MGRFGYGFRWTPADADGEGSGDGSDDGGSRHQRLPDRVVRLAGGKEYTLGFQVGDYEYNGVKFCEAVAFEGTKSPPDSEAKTVGTTELWLFDVEGCAREPGFVLAPGGGLHVVADSITQEVTDAMMALLTPHGTPKGRFKTLSQAESSLDSVAYVGGVFVDKEHQGRGLGLALMQELVAALAESGRLDSNSVVMLCPAGDPPKGVGHRSFDPRLWNAAFKSLSSYFGKIGFRACGATHSKPHDQGMYMYCWTDDVTGAPHELLPAAAAAAAAAAGNGDDGLLAAPAASTAAATCDTKKRKAVDEAEDDE